MSTVERSIAEILVLNEAARLGPHLINDARPILTFNTKCPFKSTHLLPIFNNKKRVKVSVGFSFGSNNAAVNLFSMSSIWGTLCDVNCLYSETRVMLKLGRRSRGHFVTLIEIREHLITCISGRDGSRGRVQGVCPPSLLR